MATGHGARVSRECAAARDPRRPVAVHRAPSRRATCEAGASARRSHRQPLALEPLHRAEPRGAEAPLAERRLRRPMTMANPQLLQPRLDTQAPETSDRTSQRLPDALLSDQNPPAGNLRRRRRGPVGLRPRHGHARASAHGRGSRRILQRRRRDRGDRRVAADVRVRPVRAGRARPQGNCRPRVLRPECGRGIGHRRPDGAGGHCGRPRAVLEHRRHPCRGDDSACAPPTDAGSLARGRGHGPARRLDRRLASRFRVIHGECPRVLHAELRVRGRRHHSLARAAPDRAPAARGAGPRKLSARRAARTRRHGRGLARDTGCSRAAPPSSSSARSSSAPRARPRRPTCCAGSSTKPRPPRP